MHFVGEFPTRDRTFFDANDLRDITILSVLLHYTERMRSIVSDVVECAFKRNTKPPDTPRVHLTSICSDREA